MIISASMVHHLGVIYTNSLKAYDNGGNKKSNGRPVVKFLSAKNSTVKYPMS